MLLTGRVIGAEEALRIGLVSRVVPKADLTSTVDSIIKEILSCGPEASKQLLETMRGDLIELPLALEREALCQSVNYAGAEFAEGIAALRAKRAPSFAKG